MPRPPLLTRGFAFASAASFANALAFALFFHLPGYLARLGAGETEIGFVYGVAAISSIAIRPLMGRFMDRHGRKPAILGGAAISLIFVTLYLTVTTMGPWIYLVRIGHGVGEAVAFAALYTYATDVVPASRRTEGITLFSVTTLLPFALAGVLGDTILALAGYRELFLVAAGVSGLTLLFALPLPVLGASTAEHHRARGFWRTAALSRLRPVWWLATMFSLVLTAYFAFIRVFVDVTGIGSVGLFFGAYAGVAGLERLVLWRLPDRIGERHTLIGSVVVFSSGFFVLAGTGSSLGVAVAGALCGAGHGFVYPILTAMTATRAPTPDRGSAMSLFTALFDLGGLMGGPLLGAVIEFAGFATMFTVSGVAILVAVAVFALWDRVPTPVVAGSS